MRLIFSILIIAFTTLSHLFAQPSAFPQLSLEAAGKSLHNQNSVSPFLRDVKKDSAILLPAQSRLPLDFYSTHLGTACKMELQLEKQTKLPIRIRLGSKEQVDYLEGKFSRNR